jgi:GTP-binding protein
MRFLTKFVAAATDQAHFPAAVLPEIAFLGRSNVGKSSVINSLVGSKIARTSSTPGRTQAINFFEVRRAGEPKPQLWFSDLPGYGYARAPREVSGTWASFIEPYLKERETLALCIVLVDINVPPQDSDRQLIEFLLRCQRSFAIIATKADRLSGNQRTRAVRELEAAYPEASILPFSAHTGDGRDAVWRLLMDAIRTPAA